MGHAVLMLAVLLSMLLAAAFLLGRHLSRRQYLRDELSPVSRQHIDLFQGGQLNEAMVEAAKTRLRDLLERGELAAVESTSAQGAVLWARFVDTWTAWNHVRTLTALLAAACFTIRLTRDLG